MTGRVAIVTGGANPVFSPAHAAAYAGVPVSVMEVFDEVRVGPNRAERRAAAKKAKKADVKSRVR